jgi:hypothetical protein
VCMYAYGPKPFPVLCSRPLRPTNNTYAGRERLHREARGQLSVCKEASIALIHVHQGIDSGPPMDSIHYYTYTPIHQQQARDGGHGGQGAGARAEGGGAQGGSIRSSMIVLIDPAHSPCLKCLDRDTYIYIHTHTYVNMHAHALDRVSSSLPRTLFHHHHHHHRHTQVFLIGQIRDARDESVLYTEATCLFVTSTSGLLRRQSALNMG